MVVSCNGRCTRNISHLYWPEKTVASGTPLSPLYTSLSVDSSLFTNIALDTHHSAVLRRQANHGLKGSQTSSLVKIASVISGRELKPTVRCHPWEDKKQ